MNFKWSNLSKTNRKEIQTDLTTNRRLNWKWLD